MRIVIKIAGMGMEHGMGSSAALPLRIPAGKAVYCLPGIFKEEVIGNFLVGTERLLLSRKDISSKQVEVLQRAAWALLYAHSEGFVKYCLALFYEEISARSVKCEDMPIATQIFALAKALKQIRTMSPRDMIIEVRNFKSKHLDSHASFPEVDTDSNLWPETLIALLMSADLDSKTVEKNRPKLATLVARKNEIALGQKNFIAEFRYYRTYETAVYEGMHDLALQVEERLASSPYL